MIDLNTWIDLAQFALTALIGAWFYLERKRDKTDELIGTLRTDHDSRLDDHSIRIARLETSEKSAPSHDDMKRIHARIDELNGGVKRLEGESSAQTRILNLVYESLVAK